MSRRAKLALTAIAIAVAAAPMGCSGSRASGGYPVYAGAGDMVAADSLGALVFRSDNAAVAAWTPYAGRLRPPLAPDAGPQLASYPDD